MPIFRNTTYQVTEVSTPVIRSQANTVAYYQPSPDGRFGQLYLASSFDMGMDTVAPSNLFIAIKNSLGGQGADPDTALVLRVTGKKVIDYSNIQAVQVTYGGQVYTSGMSTSNTAALQARMGQSWRQHANLFNRVIGSAFDGATINFKGGKSEWKTIYLYKMEPLDASDALPDDAEWALEPLRWPLNKFRQGGALNTAELAELVGMNVTASLPELASGRTYADIAKYGVDLSPLNPIFLSDALASVITSNAVTSRVAVHAKAGAPAESAVTIPQLSGLLGRLYNSRPLFADFSSYLRKEGDVALASKVDALTEKLSSMRSLKQQLEAAFNWNNAPPTADTWRTLDSLLGNLADPWITANASGALDDGLTEALREAESYVKTLLYGRMSEGATLNVLPMEPVSGSPDSLYYLRYIYLNNRMNKTTGTLFKAAQMQENWDKLQGLQVATGESVSSYGALVQTIPVARMEALDVIDGRIYLAKAREIINSSLDQCPVICKDFDIEPPETPYLEVWLKDNELDLLAYDPNDIIPDTLKDALDRTHKVYTEIVQDVEEEYSIRDLRQSIAEQFPQFVRGDGSYANDMEWVSGGRYGTIDFQIDRNGEPLPNPDAHSYLYNALFIRDQESFIRYGKTEQRYKVTYQLPDGEEGEAEVTLKKPVSIAGIDFTNNPQLFLTCDDVDDERQPIIIYLGRANEVRVQFDFIERELDLSGLVNNSMTPEDFKCIRGEGVYTEEEVERLNAPPLLQLTAKEIAQLIVNQVYTYGNAPDKYWMESVERKIGGQVLSVAGRPRMDAGVFDSSMAQALVREREGNPAADKQPILKNPRQPVVKMYIDFIRKVLIDVSSIQWTEVPNAELAFRRKHQLPFMRTNVRIVARYS